MPDSSNDDQYASLLIPAKANEQDVSHLPAHDPGTEGIDPDTQGANHHPGGE